MSHSLVVLRCADGKLVQIALRAAAAAMHTTGVVLLHCLVLPAGSIGRVIQLCVGTFSGHLSLRAGNRLK